MTEHLVLVGVAVIGTVVELAMLLLAIMQTRAARQEQAEATQRLAALQKATIDHLAALRGQR